jgi:hypothetical protein
MVAAHITICATIWLPERQNTALLTRLLKSSTFWVGVGVTLFDTNAITSQLYP